MRALTLGLWFILLASLLPSLAWADDCQTAQPPTTNTERIGCATPRPNTVVWRIDEPNVSQPQTTYPAIRFQTGDLINVFAGGCVQHGGTGLTWKRYVNPMTPGRNDDDQHHGTIRLPGFGGLRHIRDAVLQGGVPVLDDPGQEAQLVLGYADDGYGDNGYWGHDDGWWEQCNDLPDAWVVIVIQHNCAASSDASCVHGRALDLVADQTDDNGFPINPDWVYRRLTGTTPNAADVCGWSTKIGGFPVDNASLCTSQLTQHDGSGKCVQGGTRGDLAGHMNWIDRPVTYTGWIWWDGHDYYWDDDYTLNMAALDASKHVSGALFVEGQNNPQVEFDSDETIDHFDGVPFWSSLHSAVDTEDEKLHTANAVATGSPMPADIFSGISGAIVIGQLGLDCAHSCGTELHPAWGVFLHVKDDPTDDVWAFFARNWGDEGYCSTDDHQPGAVQAFTVRFPRPWAVGVALAATTRVGTTDAVPPYTVQMAPGGNAALFTVNLPPTSKRGLVYGELHLKWQIQLPPGITNQVAPTRMLSPAQQAAIVASLIHDNRIAPVLDTEEELTQSLQKDPKAKERLAAARINLQAAARATNSVRPTLWLQGKVIERTSIKVKDVTPPHPKQPRNEE